MVHLGPPVKDVGQRQEANQAVGVVQVHIVCLQEINQRGDSGHYGAVRNFHALPNTKRGSVAAGWEGPGGERADWNGLCMQVADAYSAGWRPQGWSTLRALQLRSWRRELPTVCCLLRQHLLPTARSRWSEKQQRK